jgi:GT2 family glycosyltransferase
MTSTVAIINWNSGHRLRACIESLLATATSADILVIDNASDDTSIESVQGFRARAGFVINSVNRGFAAAVNQAFQSTNTSYVLVLNPDVRVMPGATQILQEFMDAHPRAGAVGGYTGENYLPKSLPTIAALVRENLGVGRRMNSFHAPNSSVVQVEQPAAAALMIRRDAYDDVGGFDEQFYPAWYEDVDFCQRLRAKGWDLYFVPSAEFRHEGGYSAAAMGSQNFARSYYSNQARYARKHFGAVGSIVVRASIAAGMVGRMIARPKQAGSYGRVFLGALKGW